MNTILSQEFLLADTISKIDRDTVEQARGELFSNVDEYPLYLSSESDEDITRLNIIADEIRARYKDLIVIGTGASNTIPLSIAKLRTRETIKIQYLDNADITTFNKIMADLDPKHTAFIVISKSGETVEVLALTLLAINWAGNDHFYMISEPGLNNLRKIAAKINATNIDHPKEVGGRFAVFSAVGLLIAAIVGFDIERIIECAKHSFREQTKPSSFTCEAVCYRLAMKKKYNNSVFMIYGDQFSGLNNWHRQLIAESLARDGLGINPMIAAGLIDQHSQLQLYLDGPDDKYYTFLCNKHDDYGYSLDGLDIASLNFLSMKKLHDIMDAQLKSVIRMLAEKKRNIRVVSVKQINEQFIAEFMLSQILEVILFAYTQGVNPFGQPAVEQIKNEIKHNLRHSF